jgi:hypothetical protein
MAGGRTSAAANALLWIELGAPLTLRDETICALAQHETPDETVHTPARQRVAQKIGATCAPNSSIAYDWS